jgi:hypothetical protein
MERWELVVALAFALLALSAASPLASAHKLPIVEYTYVGHIWEEAYTTAPREPIVGENLTLEASVEHPGGYAIDGNVTAQLSVYADETTYGWFGGEPYKSPGWLLMKEEWMSPAGTRARSFTSGIVIDRPGSYHVLIDWYEDGQYIGQSMHTLDVEQRTVGPAFLVFAAIATIAVLAGVKMGVL